MAQTIDLQGLGPGFMHTCRARGYWPLVFLLADHMVCFFGESAALMRTQ